MNRAQMETYLTLKGWRPAKYHTTWVGVADCHGQLCFIHKDSILDGLANKVSYATRWNLLNAQTIHMHFHLCCEWSDIQLPQLRKLFRYILKELS